MHCVWLRLRGTSCVLIKNGSDTDAAVCATKKQIRSPHTPLHPAAPGRAIICRRKLRKFVSFQKPFEDSFKVGNLPET